MSTTLNVYSQKQVEPNNASNVSAIFRSFGNAVTLAEA